MLTELPVFVHLFRDVFCAGTAGHSLRIGVARTLPPRALRWLKCKQAGGSRPQCRFATHADSSPRAGCGR